MKTAWSQNTFIYKFSGNLDRTECESSLRLNRLYKIDFRVFQQIFMGKYKVNQKLRA